MLIVRVTDPCLDHSIVRHSYHIFLLSRLPVVLDSVVLLAVCWTYPFSLAHSSLKLSLIVAKGSSTRLLYWTDIAH